MKVLIDSSAWIHFLRPDGDEAVRARVRSALLTGQACWCPMVRLELWNGARGDKEKQVLKEFEADLIELPMPAEVWELAFDKARRARASGLTVPATDILIAACASFHGVGLEHADGDFDRLAAIGLAAGHQ